MNSKDIVNLQIGNIPPKTKVKITVSFVQELSLGMNQFYQLQIPSTISPRFMNTIPNPSTEIKTPSAASTIDNLETFILKEIYKPDYTWNFLLTVKASKKIIFEKSSSHSLVKTFSNEEQT